MARAFWILLAPDFADRSFAYAWGGMCICDTVRACWLQGVQKHTFLLSLVVVGVSVRVRVRDDTLIPLSL